MALLIPITNLKDLLGLAESLEIVEYSTDYLTSVFDNYGSLMLKLRVVTKDTKSLNETVMSLVCKLYPPSDEWQEMFQIDRTFEKEAKFYTQVIPELEQFQRELNISDPLDIFIKCHGARLEERSGEVVIEAAMVLDNIKLQGYDIGKRSEGFDREHVSVILKKLAQFNAVPLALKIKKPKVFQEKILPVVTKVDLNDGLGEKEREGMKMVRW